MVALAWLCGLAPLRLCPQVPSGVAEAAGQPTFDSPALFPFMAGTGSGLLGRQLQDGLDGDANGYVDQFFAG